MLAEDTPQVITSRALKELAILALLPISMLWDFDFPNYKKTILKY